MADLKKRRKRKKPVEYPDDPVVLAQAIFKAADKKRDDALVATKKNEE